MIKRILIAFLLLVLGISIIISCANARENSIQDKIAILNEEISSMTEAQNKTHELANYCRSVLNTSEDSEIIKNLKTNWHLIDNKKLLAKKELDELEKISNNYIGEFKITGYTASPAENGGWATTALGDDLKSSVGWAIAVDPKVIPLGAKVYIEGIGYRVARDTGGAIKGKKIDVLTSSNSESRAITGNYKVYLVK